MDKVYLNRPNVCEVLRSKIRAYKKEHPRLNSSQIARKFGIATSTFNRIENLDIRNPSIDQAVKILRGVGSSEDVADFIRMYYPEIHEGLFEYFVETSKMNDVNESIEKYFHDEATYKMMLYASSYSGLDENFVLQEFGRSGHKTFMKLAAKGILVNKNGRFYTASKDNYVDDYSAAKIASFICDELAHNNKIGEQLTGRFELVYASVDMMKIGAELKTLTEDYYLEARKIIKDQNNAGETLVTLCNLVQFFN
jgi:transcriptional regulator with XRE-family HTH domain